MTDKKNDIAWTQLFSKYEILEKIERNDYYEINSNEINEFREARLMTKFDYESQLPKIFLDNNLSILPTSRGNYIISDFETFKSFETENPTPININFPNYLESIKHENITSESTALNCAYVTGIIEDFVEDYEIKPTVSGRMSSLSFDYMIKTRNSEMNIEVQNSQIEIDGGYEGLNFLSLIEAKNSISDDFLIRQLFYPFKLWNNKINKRVKSIFLTYTNGVFHFREYFFEDSNYYNSLVLVKEKKYIVREYIINMEVIVKITYEIEIVNELELPFPQADSFERVINLCELIHDNVTLTHDDITLNYDFDERQTNYYTDAGRYLGLIEKTRENNEITFKLSSHGKQMFNLNISDRQIEYIKLILSHGVFNRVMKKYFEYSELPSRDEIVEIMMNEGLYNINSTSTFRRRASTIISWLNWILSQIEE